MEWRVFVHVYMPDAQCNRLYHGSYNAANNLYTKLHRARQYYVQGNRNRESVARLPRKIKYLRGSVVLGPSS